MNDITTPQLLLDYMKENLQYGWIGIDGSKHIENLNGFRSLYLTSSSEQVFKTGLGTCIESAIVAKSWLDSENIDNRLFCHRSCETEDSFDKEVKMHIIILYKEKDKWIHFEHSNRPEQGLHEYNSVESAITDITEGFEASGDIRVLTEITDIPSGLSFKEFNNYVNSFENSKSNKIK
ncbi:MAG: transglutaminase domain-containing protein [Bacilli bacterium]|nr:transglutaminase domain-containing protein [Bacilli bacterium]